MHFEVDAIAQVTSVPVARGEQPCASSAVSASTHHSSARVTSMMAWNIFSSGAGFCFSVLGESPQPQFYSGGHR
jgi:hypothetical protein